MLSDKNVHPNHQRDASIDFVTLQRLNSEQFAKFSEFIYRECGIRIEKNKVTLLSNRIRRRLQRSGLDDFDAYFQYLTSRAGKSELGEFFDAITTNETFFFRTPKHFEWLVNEWLDQQIESYRQERRKPQLKIWSAGCSSGAEPYSISICLDEQRLRLRDWSIQILGTDISQENLKLARQGLYPPRIVESVSPSRLRRYFRHRPDQNLWELREAIRETVQFKQHNLMKLLGENEFDLIFIRNVLIYFDADSKQTVIDCLLRSLAPSGHLVVGPSEGTYGMLKGLKRISPLIFQKTEG